MKEISQPDKENVKKPKTGLAAIVHDLSHIRPLKEDELDKPLEKNHSGSSLFGFKNNNHLLDEQAIDGSEKIIKVDPNKIRLSPNKKDRMENELGDLEELAESMKQTGQIQPCVVESCKEKNSAHDYLLIIGERRWRASKIAGIKLDVVVRKITEEKSFEQQIKENLQRKNLSDYALGIFCSDAVNTGIVTRKKLQEILSINEIEITRLFSFSSIPKEILEAIGDMQLVSRRTAAEIRALAKKGEKYISAIIEIAPKIESGKIGEKLIKREIDKIVNFKTRENPSLEIKSITGQHLFSWRKDSNGNDSISFPKDIRERINKEELQSILKDSIEKMINKDNKP